MCQEPNNKKKTKKKEEKKNHKNNKRHEIDQAATYPKKLIKTQKRQSESHQHHPNKQITPHPNKPTWTNEPKHKKKRLSDRINRPDKPPGACRHSGDDFNSTQNDRQTREKRQRMGSTDNQNASLHFPAKPNPKAHSQHTQRQQQQQQYTQPCTPSRAGAPYVPRTYCLFPNSTDGPNSRLKKNASNNERCPSKTIIKSINLTNYLKHSQTY